MATSSAHELTYKLLSELGVDKPNDALAEQLEDHFSKVIVEVLLRRVPEEKLPMLKEKIEGDAPDLETAVAEIAAEIPGLADELEEAVLREYEVLKNLMQKKQ